MVKLIGINIPLSKVKAMNWFTDDMQVCQSVRIEITYQGKDEVAICLDDLTLSVRPSDFKRHLKRENWGKHNVLKNLVIGLLQSLVPLAVKV